MLVQLRNRGIAALAAAVVLGGVHAQTIRIPDFRQPAPSVRTNLAGPCEECAVVRSIREINRRRDAPVYQTSVSALDNRVVGPLVALPFGATSSERSPSYVVGGAGTPEMNDRFGERSYELTLRMDDGSYRTVERRDGAQYSIGDRVRLTEGRLDILTP
jgi:hypothetical protein